MRKNWLWYQFFRYPLVKFGLYLYYRRITVKGKEHIPKDKPILFVPNHQNSFMDALLVVTHIKPFMYFLTGAHAFKPALQGAFIRSLNMLPVYRVRDGLSSVVKNKEVFDECIRHLKRKDVILIFPEANHDLRRRIRPLSKGFTRIAFAAEEQESWNMDLQVVPVGLNYSEHRNSRTDVEVVFGTSIQISDFEEIYKKDEREAGNILKRRVSEEMKKLTMHVVKPSHYPLHHVLLDDLEDDRSNLINPEIANQNVKRIESEASSEQVGLGDFTYHFLREYNLTGKDILGKKKSVLKRFVWCPLFLFSWLNNIISYQPIKKVISEKIKDHAYDASIKLLLSVIFFPAFWLLISTILVVIGVPWSYVLGYLILSVWTSTLFREANDWARSLGKKRRLNQIKNQHPEEFDKMIENLASLNEFREKVLS